MGKDKQENNNLEEQKNYNLEDYLKEEKTKGRNKEQSVCREERQYALFLYTLLLCDNENIEGFKDIKNDLEINGEIKEVYYEAALMRDFRESSKNKKEFNRNLLRFCFNGIEKFNSRNCDKDASEVRKRILELINPNDEEEETNSCDKNEEDEKRLFQSLLSYHLGATKGIKKIKKICEKIEVNDENGETKTSLKHSIRRRFLIARYMMNVEPDIVVIYEDSDKEEYHAKALECKYTQPEGKYQDLSGKSKTIPQTLIQKAIMKFLFGPPQGNANEKKTKDICEEYKECIAEMSSDDENGLLKYKKKCVINDGVQIVRFVIPERNNGGEKIQSSNQCDYEIPIDIDILLKEYERLKNANNH